MYAVFTIGKLFPAYTNQNIYATFGLGMVPMVYIITIFFLDGLMCILSRLATNYCSSVLSKF